MTRTLSRRGLLCSAPAACGVAAWLGIRRTDDTVAFGSAGDAKIGDGPPAEFPGQGRGEVKEIVRFAHFDVDRVRQLVSARPALAKASWDWGFGDWESAIGAASHMGRHDIAALLLEHGARPTIFTFAMSGKLEPVQAMIEASPGIRRTHGPHGITLLAHARIGGPGAEPVVKYLESLGDADIEQKGLPVPAEERKSVQGTYAFGEAEGERLVVSERKGTLVIKRIGHAPRDMIRVGSWEYHPTGAPAVRLRFESGGSKRETLSIIDAELKVVAQRIS
jgi:hypothetical protein